MTAAAQFNIEDKVVFVSGGAGDIGSVIVKAFADQGSRVVVADLDRGRAEAVAEACRTDRVAASKLDVTCEDSVHDAVLFTARRFAPIDVLVNVAGVLCRKSFFETTRQDFEASFGVNVTGLFLISRQVAEAMKPRGHGAIIHISSMNAKLATENRALYAATKSAVNSLTQSMAVELAPFGITVNAVAPGIVDSRMARVRLNTPELMRKYSECIPLKQLTLPEDVAHCVLFLASPYAKNICGEIITVDGGLTVRMALPQPGEGGTLRCD